MNIIADENIMFAKEILSRFGDVHLMHGRSITAADVKDADIMVIRSVTPINEGLLEGSRVRFIGTATVGFDHVDLEYVNRAGIHFVTAKGSNSHSVADWVVAALAEYCRRRQTTLEGKRLGIIGRGNIGTLLTRKARALGLRVLVNDPPLERAGVEDDWVNLDDLLRTSDFVSCHVPLTMNGENKTYHLIAERELGLIKQSATLVNSSRGAVVDNPALLQALEKGVIADAILDVFEGEPNPDYGLISRAALATPHIAGYSFDGKVNGTLMMAEELARFLGADVRIDSREYLPECPPLDFDLCAGSAQPVHTLVGHLYPIWRDDEALRALADLPPDERRPRYDHMRKNYPRRRDFHRHSVRAGGISPSVREALELLGLKIAAAED